MKVHYRISSESYNKLKLPGADKRTCLTNMQVIFEQANAEFLIIADNCDKDLLKTVKESGLPYEETNLGNAGALYYSLDRAISEYKDNDLLYTCEDDYLHLPIAPRLLTEGIQHSEYITLYDHPDKYTHWYGLGETSKVMRTPSCHWRHTISTCMTFGTQVKYLKEDIETFKKHEDEGHPQDHLIFTELKEKGRNLSVCLPGAACHVDLTFSGMMDRMMIDPWATEMMIKKLEDELEKIQSSVSPEDNEKINEMANNVLKQRIGWDRLKYLDALINSIKSTNN